jgi:hypothetical protein
MEAARIAGDSSLAMLALWKSPARLVAVRAGNPLFLGRDKTGWYFASQLAALPVDARPVSDDSALSFSLRSGRAALVRSRLPARHFVE